MIQRLLCDDNQCMLFLPFHLVPARDFLKPLLAQAVNTVISTTVMCVAGPVQGTRPVHADAPASTMRRVASLLRAGYPRSPQIAGFLRRQRITGQ